MESTLSLMNGKIHILAISPDHLFYIWCKGFKSWETTVNIFRYNQAILASENGDTIYVDNGIYREKNILINKSITLLGNNYPVVGWRTYSTRSFP